MTESYSDTTTLNIERLRAMVACYQEGKYQDARNHASELVNESPYLQVAWKVLGALYRREGKLEESESATIRAIGLSPDDYEAHFNLGNTLRDFGRLTEAQRSYRRALKIAPLFLPACINLGAVCIRLGEWSEALKISNRALEIEPTHDAKTLYVEVICCVPDSFLNFSHARSLLMALTEPWSRPSWISVPVSRLLLRSEHFLNLRKYHQLHSEKNSNVTDKYPEWAPLFNALLRSGPVANLSLESFCSILRHEVLELALCSAPQTDHEGMPSDLYFAIAHQYYLKEYIDSFTEGEWIKVESLQRRIEHQITLGASVPIIWILAISCYRPLSEVAGSERLIGWDLPQEVQCLLEQQILEPKLESELGPKIPRLGTIEDPISLEVREQYEEHPYPRWVKLPKTSIQKTLNDLIIGKFPLADYRPIERCNSPEVLVAGCGTGQHPIETAMLIKSSTVHAIDLSKASLAYAMRKTNELDIKTIRYYQADILNTEQIENTFDLIESVGVLHHLEDPLYGWQLLAKKLRPNGVMRIGLYSQLARREIITLRQRIQKEGIGSTAQEIREFRRTLIETRKPDQYGWVENSADFFSTSACRDLLFHVQEHQMNLTIITQFLERNGFVFLGFDIDHSVILSYRKIYPNDLAAINLANWEKYERLHPNTFAGMYQFWILKIK